MTIMLTAAALRGETNFDKWPYRKLLEFTGCALCARPRADNPTTVNPNLCQADFGDYRGCVNPTPPRGES